MVQDVERKKLRELEYKIWLALGDWNGDYHEWCINALNHFLDTPSSEVIIALSQVFEEEDDRG